MECCEVVVAVLGQVWMVVRTARRRITAVCCDWVVRLLGQVLMVVRRLRPSSGEENRGGMLQCGGASPWSGVDGGAAMMRCLP